MVAQDPKPQQPTSPDPRAWLDHIPPSRRGPLANWWHIAVRQGATTPALVLLAIRETCRRRAWGRPQEVEDAACVLQAIDDDPGGALAYAQSVIAYEALP